LPVHLKLRDPEVSFLEGVLGRGDRRFADVIETAWRKGARFDAWKEWFRFETWTESFAECGIDPSRYAAAIDTEAPLPWAHIDKGNLTTEFLLRQRERAWKAAEEDTSSTLGEEEMPFAAPEDVGPTRAKTEMFFPQFKSDDRVNFGRSPRRKRVTPNAPISPAKGQVRLRWRKENPARFTSHLDSMRALERAIRRADIPVAYTEGFNPHMKLSFGPPLPLGFVSDDEYFDLHLEGVFTEFGFRKLQAALPNGFSVAAYRPLYNTRESLAAMLNRASYEVALDEPMADLDDRIGAFLVTDEVTVHRPRKNKDVNIRPSVVEINTPEHLDGAGLGFTLKLGEPDAAKPLEVVRAVTGMSDERTAALRVRRTRLYTSRGGREYSPLDVA